MTEELLRCYLCGHAAPLDGYDVMGADPGNLFCNDCGGEVSAERLTVVDGDADYLTRWSGQSYDRQPRTDYAGPLSLRRLAAEVEVHETDHMCGGGPVG